MTLKEYVVSHIVNLIKIKSVVTLALTSAFVVLSLKGEVAPDQFLMIFTTVIAFYFGTQKKEESPTTEEGTEKDSTTNSETVIDNTSTNSSTITEPREDEYHEN